MIPTLIIVACAAGLGVFWYSQRAEKKEPTRSAKRVPPKAPKKPVNDFASVELRCGRTACKTALDLVGQPILAVEAPVLPLPDCDVAACQCSYRKIDDRREDTIGRRTSDHGIEPLIFDGTEQRATNADRRTG